MFIDESGDAGFKIDSGSSKYFIIALIAFEDHNEAKAADDRINLLRREMGLSDRFEFHFNKMKAAQRKVFLSTIAPFDFFYWGIVINKAKLMRCGFQFQESFYKYACGLVFENAKPRLSNAIVVVDGSGSKDFRKQLKTYLARRLKDDSGKCLIKKLKRQDSKKNNLLQMADMVVGSIARAYSGKGDARECRKLIAHREMYVQFWPK
ncbi:MAG TPA: DUF3800 domain-containing protein [Pyrinomonadaceae bacterium]|nr:DUF3800 domain-containing protein [Pyrinomonadaceae bacterium]